MSELNTVTVKLIEVRAEGGQVFGTASPDVCFPPALSRDIVCVENQDVRADFLLTFVRRAQQGFVDVVVQVQDVFCSYKVSCEQALMADPEPPFAPGPTLVTGFACTDGEVIETGANFVASDAVEEGCVFYGRGYFNWSDEGGVASYAWFSGADGVSPAPGFFFTTLISAANEDGEMFCDNSSVQVYWGP